VQVLTVDLKLADGSSIALMRAGAYTVGF